MFHAENWTGISASTSMPPLVRSVDTWKVTDLVTPCMARSPVAEYWAAVPIGGTVSRAIGAVRWRVAVGYWVTSMILPSNCALRWPWSLTTDAMFTVKVPWVTVVPETVSAPETWVDRPTAVVC